MDKKITEYKMLNGTKEFDVFNQKIEKMIEDGYQPFGSPFIHPSYGTLHQAMVKYSNKRSF